MDYTMQHGTVVDGTGAARFTADVLIRDGKIAEMTPHLPRILGHYARDMGLLTLEEAIRKMTSLPADILHLSDRGMLQPGKAADIVVFNPETIRERSSYEDPRQYPEGIAYVFVNGRPVIAGSRSTGARPGHLLQHQG